MEILNLIILIGLVILVFIFLNKPVKKKKIPKIDINNIYINDDHNDIIYKDNNNFYKTHYAKHNSDKEIKQINIEKGKITRQSILDETGGSVHYNNVQINSNISGNIIEPSSTYSTYVKKPYTINR
jgi:hypothetical protein